MSDSSVFDRVADALDEMTDLSRLESRGTLRIVLKKAGFEARSVSPSELAVVLQKLLPQELVARGIENSEQVSEALVSSLSEVASASEGQDTPDAVFRRLSS